MSDLVNPIPTSPSANIHFVLQHPCRISSTCCGRHQVRTCSSSGIKASSQTTRRKQMTVNENLMEHNLTHNSTEVQQRCTGAIDFFSPARAMADKEGSKHEEAEAIREDATDCARKLNFLMIAKKASLPGGIHRENACASQKIAAAVGHYSKGETFEEIGQNLNIGHRQGPSRYSKRFVSWSADKCQELLTAYTPEAVIGICTEQTTESLPLADVLDEFRQQLTDLFFSLHEAAEEFCQQGVEVYATPSLYQENEIRPINITALLEI